MISILTAFNIEAARALQPNPGDVTNQILIAIYNQTMNASNPINFDKYLRLDEGTRKSAASRALVISICMALALVIAALATIARIWIVRYSREVNAPKPGPPRLRVMKRQKMYDGSLAWKLGEFIELLPLFSLVVIILLILFILRFVVIVFCNIGYSHSLLCCSNSSALKDRHPFTPWVVGFIFQLGLCYLAITTFSGAFISNSPFRSSLSDFIGSIFRIFPNYQLNLLGKIRIHLRTVGVILTALLVLGAMGYYLRISGDPKITALIHYPIAAGFALVREGEVTDVPRRRYSPQFCLFISVSIGLIAYAVVVFLNFSIYSQSFYVSFPLFTFLMAVLSRMLIKMAETMPATTAVEAVAWMLKTSSSPNPAWFQKAVQFAGDSHNTRALLLDHLLPLAEPLIVHASGDDAQGTTALQEAYLDCLKNLTDLPRFHGNFWCNEAPIPSKTLRRRLEELNVECPQMIKNSEHYMEGCPRCRIKLIAEDALKRFDLIGNDMQKGQKKLGMNRDIVYIP